MPYLLIIKDDEIYNSDIDLHLFSTFEKAEEWINIFYKYQIVPDYDIIYVTLDPEPMISAYKYSLN